MNVPLTARDLMQKEVHFVPPDMPLWAVEREFVQKRVSGFPVVEKGVLLGVVSRSDIVRQLLFERRLAQTTSDFYWDREGFHEAPTETLEQIAGRVGERIENLCVRDLMSRQLVALGAEDSIEIIAQKFLDNHIHRAPVVEEGRLVGIISTLDLVRLFADRRVELTR